MEKAVALDGSMRMRGSAALVSGTPPAAGGTYPWRLQSIQHTGSASVGTLAPSSFPFKREAAVPAISGFDTLHIGQIQRPQPLGSGVLLSHRSGGELQSARLQ